MNAQEALELTKSKTPEIVDKEYNDILKSIKCAAERGETSLYLGCNMPNGRVVDRLRHDGFRFCSTRDDFLFPAMYSVTWKKEIKRIKRKKWWQKLFNKGTT